MNIKTTALIIATFVLSFYAVQAISREDTVIANKVSNLLAQMTLEEKIGQMTQIDFAVIGGDPNADFPMDTAKLDDAIINHYVGSILNTPFDKGRSVETWRKIMQTVQDTAAKSRLKIPVIYGIDAIHGATYTKNATLFPQAINMAATFNPELSGKEGEITAREIKVSGLAWNFYPVMDIGRQPLWARLWETYGEDVHLATCLLYTSPSPRD